MAMVDKPDSRTLKASINVDDWDYILSEMPDNVRSAFIHFVITYFRHHIKM